VNRKILFVFVALATVAMLATPIIGSAMAGKGEEKLDFLLHMVGHTQPPAEKSWLTDGGIRHVQGLPWVVSGDFYIEIGTGGAVETITKDYLSYEGFMDLTVNSKEGFYVGTVRETISIYSSASVHDAAHLRGTLEILNMAQTNTGANQMFDGRGTNEFEGVKLHGTSVGVSVSNILTLDRTGTVMGWPD
jgi:hypothetical protein